MSDERFFKYRRLPPTYMRLLLLAPGNPGDEITGTLTMGHIIQFGRDKWRYNALSYTWGDATKITRIRLRETADGHDGWLTVTTSVVEA